jgi:hypothetical protein
MRGLVIDEEVRGRVQRVLAYAEQNVYHPRKGRLPGNDARLVLQLNTYCCVFSYTMDQSTGDLYRHLSISIPREGYMAHPVVVAELAGLYGFSGHEQGVEARLANGAWLINVNKQDHCIVLGEKLADEQSQAILAKVESRA